MIRRRRRAHRGEDRHPEIAFSIRSYKEPRTNDNYSTSLDSEQLAKHIGFSPTSIEKLRDTFSSWIEVRFIEALNDLIFTERYEGIDYNNQLYIRLASPVRSSLGMVKDYARLQAWPR